MHILHLGGLYILLEKEHKTNSFYIIVEIITILYGQSKRHD